MYLHVGRAEPAATARPEVAATPRSLPLTRVRDTRLLPFGLICRIVTRSYDKPDFSVGTGMLINRHHVLTCAHNIYPHQTPRTKTIDVIPMQNGPDGKWPVFRANG